MPQFHCPILPSAIAAGDTSRGLGVTLDREQSHHLLRVMRAKPGDEVRLFDGQGTQAWGVLAAEPGQLANVMLKRVERAASDKPAIWLAAPVPRGSHGDEMIRQLSQVGVDRFIPLRPERAVVNPGDGKLDKFRRLALESAKQCGRAYLMEIAAPASPREVIDSAAGAALRLIAMPEASNMSLPAPGENPPTAVLILVGPEGGWTPAELELAQRSGCVALVLGPHVMRIETAAVVAGAIVRRHFLAMAAPREK